VIYLRNNEKKNAMLESGDIKEALSANKAVGYDAYSPS
jgi:predicted metalloprotease